MTKTTLHLTFHIRNVNSNHQNYMDMIKGDEKMKTLFKLRIYYSVSMYDRLRATEVTQF